MKQGGGAHLTKSGWTKPHTHSNPTNLALFRHKITLYRFNKGGSYYCRWAQMGAGGWAPLTLTTEYNTDRHHTITATTFSFTLIQYPVSNKSTFVCSNSILTHKHAHNNKSRIITWTAANAECLLGLCTIRSLCRVWLRKCTNT